MDVAAAAWIGTGTVVTRAERHAGFVLGRELEGGMVGLARGGKGTAGVGGARLHVPSARGSSDPLLRFHSIDAYMYLQVLERSPPCFARSAPSARG